MVAWKGQRELSRKIVGGEVDCEPRDGRCGPEELVQRGDRVALGQEPEAEKQALLLGEPERFFTTPTYDGVPLVMLRLEKVDVDRLEELVTDAWRMRAPDTLVGDLDAAADLSSPGPG